MQLKIGNAPLIILRDTIDEMVEEKASDLGTFGEISSEWSEAFLSVSCHDVLA